MFSIIAQSNRKYEIAFMTIQIINWPASKVCLQLSQTKMIFSSRHRGYKKCKSHNIQTFILSKTNFRKDN